MEILRNVKKKQKQNLKGTKEETNKKEDRT